MCKTAKIILSLVMVLYFVFLTLFGLGDFLYPDTISQFHGEKPESRLCFSVSEEQEKAVFSSLDSSPVTTKDCRLLAFGFLPIKELEVNYYPKTEVVCGGELFGLRINTNGLLVTAVASVETSSGSISPGEKAGLQKGDVLLRADGVELKSATDLAKIISKSGGGKIRLEVTRQGKSLSLTLTPALAADQSGYKAGLWIRDGAAGIGTVTFRDPVTGSFAGLGHAVCDSESGAVFPLRSGSVCPATVESIQKGLNGSPGEIHGKLEKDEIGSLTANTPYGVFGTLTSPCNKERTVPIGLKDQVKTGSATIFCTLDNNVKKEYEIQIEEIIGKDRDTKNFILRITDPELLEKTGGIIQGMSGSPILQDGKLIGAVTHVLVGDPTRGYGIFIENMISAAQ